MKRWRHFLRPLPVPIRHGNAPSHVVDAKGLRTYCQHSSYLKSSLAEADGQVQAMVQQVRIALVAPIHPHSLLLDDVKSNSLAQEAQIQAEAINLHPHTQYISMSVSEAMGSGIQVLNSEGKVGQRYYPACEQIDDMETLCHERALAAFGLDGAEWSVNAQSLNRHLACLQVCSALLQNHDRLIAQEQPGCKSIAERFMTVCLSDRRVGYLKNDAGNSEGEGMFFQRLIDTFQPRVLLSNASASASWNSSTVLQRANDAHLCRERGIHVVADITETAGLVAAGIHAAPFEHADVVIAGTHGSLRGPNGTLIFVRKTKAVGAGYDEETDLPDAVERSVFPGHQGGPHNHTIAAVTTALKQVLMPTFQVYQRQALANAEALADRLRCLGYRLRDITEDEAPHSHHLVVRVLVGQDAAAADVADLLRLTLEVIGVEVGHLVVVAEDEVQLHLGTLAMSSRQWFRQDFRWVADIIHEAISISKASEHELDDPHIHELRREVLIKMQSNKLGSAE